MFPMSDKEFEQGIEGLWDKVFTEGKHGTLQEDQRAAAGEATGGIPTPAGTPANGDQAPGADV